MTQFDMLDRDVESLVLDSDSRLELENILNGTFSPLRGFMTSRDYRSVVDDRRLADGSPWTIPVTLEAPEPQVERLRKAKVVSLVDLSGHPVARLEVEDIFRVDLSRDLPAIFKVDTREHPGVRKEASRSPYRIGGFLRRLGAPEPVSDDGFPYFSPAQSAARFAALGWKKITGFQTRNPLHRAHEYLHRIAMEVSDGLFIQPLMGWKKPGDFTAEAVFAGYQKMIDEFYPSDRVVLGSLRTAMRYAGPREAVFHALIRRNHGCTHFIIGRDHAGVGGFYGKYEAQELALSMGDLGIEILALCGPYHCRKCQGIVTEKTCAHGGEDVQEVSGTLMRAAFSSGRRPPDEFMRPEVADVLLGLGEKGQLIYE